VEEQPDAAEKQSLLRLRFDAIDTEAGIVQLRVIA
jgi:hypothetical protein